MCWRPALARSGLGLRLVAVTGAYCRCRRRLKVCKCKQSKICPRLFYGSELMNVANEQKSKREKEKSS